MISGVQNEELRARLEEINARTEEIVKISEALRESEERYRSVFEQSAVGMTHVSKDGRYLKVNQKYCDLTGYNSEELVKMYVADITYPPDIAEEILLIKRLLAGEITTFSREKRYVKKDGVIVWVNLTVTSIYNNGTLDYLTGVTEDITEHKRAEEALRESEASLARAQFIAHIGNWSWDLGTNELEYSDECYRLLGYKPGEIRPVSFDFFISHIHPDDKEPFICAIRESIQGFKPFSIDFRLVRPDGNIVYMHDDGEVRYDAGGDPVRMFGTVQDITERKQAEEAVKDAKTQAELYLDLMGHDISNMHQIILGQLQLAEEIMREDGKLEGDDKEMIDRSINNLKRSAKLIDNVKKLQKLRAGEYSKEPVDLGQVLNDVVTTYSSVPDKKVVISYTPAQDHVALVNPLIKEVFNNLMDNAVKHSGDPVQIGITVDRANKNCHKYHRVAIEDNGPGIPDEKKEDVFLRLKRGQTKARGTGLGLFIVKTLVESFNGIVEVADRIAGDYTKGARFVVYLPVVEDDDNGK